MYDFTNAFVDAMCCNEFRPLMSRPTRITYKFATLSDDIFTNTHDDLNFLTRPVVNIAVIKIDS